MSLTDEQKKLRRQGVGGSEISALVGLNPFAGPLDVYLSKVEGREIETNHHMERGTFLEDGSAKWYAHRTGATLREVGTIAHPDMPIILCTPDRLAKMPDGSEIDVSVKVPSRRAEEHWGEDGSDDVPEMYLVQLQWELCILKRREGITNGVIVAPFDDLCAYPIAGDAELQDMLVGAASKFWMDHVEKRVPPPVDGSDTASQWLLKRFPKATRGVVRATDEAEKIARELAQAKRAMKSAEGLKDTLENRLCELIGEAKGLEGEGWRATWSEVGESSVAYTRKAYRRLTFSGKGLEKAS